MLFEGINTMEKKNQVFLALALVLAIAVIASMVFLTENQQKLLKENTHVTLALPVQPWSWWIPFYTAVNQGYYAEEGLDVSFIYSQEGGFGVIKQVAAGNAIFGYAGADSLLVARSKGIPVVTVYQDAHGSSWSIIAKKEIKDLKDLEGKTIAIQGPNNPLHLAAIAMLKKVGVNTDKINWVPVGSQAMVSTFLGGKADAITGNDLYKLTLVSRKAEFNIWYADDYDATLVAMSPLVTEDTLKNNPKLVEKFLRATKKGEKYAISHPEEAVDAYIGRFNPSANREMEQQMWKNYIDEVIQPDKYQLGQFDRTQWEKTEDILYKLGVIENRVDIDKAYTEEFLDKI